MENYELDIFIALVSLALKIVVEETFLASLSRGEFFNLAFNLPGAAYSQRDDIGLIPRSFNSETPRQRDTFKHIEAGSCSRSSFALSSPFHIYLGLLHYAATRTSPFLFFSSPFYRSVSPGLSAYSATNATAAIRNEHADCFCAPREFTSGNDKLSGSIIEWFS